MANVSFSVKQVISALKGVNGNKVWKTTCNALADLCRDDWKLDLPVPDLPSPGDVVGELGGAPTPPSAPPIDVVAALGQIAEAITNASSVLDRQHLMVASGSVSVDVNVKIPGTDVGAESHLALQIGPKPYS